MFNGLWKLCKLKFAISRNYFKLAAYFESVAHFSDI